MRPSTRRPRSATVVAGILVAAGILGSTLHSCPARAQLAGVAPIRPLRLEGYWDRDRSAPGVLDGIEIAHGNADVRRTFGVTALQAYKPEEEGIQVLRHSSLQPSLRLLGRDDMVRRFMDAPTTAKVVAFGVYRAASGTITLSSVEVTGEREDR